MVAQNLPIPLYHKIHQRHWVLSVMRFKKSRQFQGNTDFDSRQYKCLTKRIVRKMKALPGTYIRGKTLQEGVN